MAKKHQQSKQVPVQLTKERRVELENKINCRKSVIRYVELRVKKEKKNKKEILESGDNYYGVLPTLIAILKRMKNDSYWGEDSTANIELKLK